MEHKCGAREQVFEVEPVSFADIEGKEKPCEDSW